jgi:hypothetical protein
MFAALSEIVLSICNAVAATTASATIRIVLGMMRIARILVIRIAMLVPLAVMAVLL